MFWLYIVLFVKLMEARCHEYGAMMVNDFLVRKTSGVMVSRRTKSTASMAWLLSVKDDNIRLFPKHGKGTEV